MTDEDKAIEKQTRHFFFVPRKLKLFVLFMEDFKKYEARFSNFLALVDFVLQCLVEQLSTHLKQVIIQHFGVHS